MHAGRTMEWGRNLWWQVGVAGGGGRVGESPKPNLPVGMDQTVLSVVG